ncbi:MAG: DUF192 domain-containing protein [Candidatus Methylomirabilales bacterium]
MIGRRYLPWILLCLLTAVAEAAGGGQVRIGDRVAVTVEVARTEAEKIRGLSGRERLQPDGGMLFVYEVPVRPLIWMRGMRFPLDILWIRDGRVVDLVQGAKPPIPGEAPQVFAPREEVQYVLEVPAGFAERHGIVLADPVVIRLEKGRAQ